MEDNIFTYLFIAAFILVIAYLISLQIMFKAAQESDPSLFQEMGSPHIIKNNKPRHTILILKVLLSFKYLKSSSGKVVIWGNISMAFFTLTLLSYACLAYVL